MWDIRYRPLSFGDVVGQDGSIQVLRARIQEGTAHDISYVFAGPHGCGKTTLARILARALLCQQLDDQGNPCNQCDHCKGCLNETFAGFSEFDAASQGTTADMRALVDSLAYDIPGVKKRVFLLDEAHRMSRDGQDVLLKAIEDKRMVVIFATTELSKIRDTIKSRCEVYEIRKTPREHLLARMQKVLQAEKVDYEDVAVYKVIDLAKGHVRDILNKLETIAQTGPVTLDNVQDRLNLGVSDTYLQILANLSNPAVSLPLLDEVCDRVGAVAVATGLADAAMDAYRSGLGIYVESTSKEAADPVFQAIGERLPSLATYFLRQPYTSKSHLTCDLLQCANPGYNLLGSVKVPTFSVTTESVTQSQTATTLVETLPVTSVVPSAPTSNPPQEPSKPPSNIPEAVSSKVPPLTRNDSACTPPVKPRGPDSKDIEASGKKESKLDKLKPLSDDVLRVKVLRYLQHTTGRI